MSYNDDNKKIWDEHFSKVLVEYPNEEVVRFLASCKKYYPNGKMLDWGCATGRHTTLGCEMGYKVIAADYVERCIDITRKMVEEKNLSDAMLGYVVNQDVDIEEIEDNSLDVVVAAGLLLLSDKEAQGKILKNIHRMLKKGGRAFVDFKTVKDETYITADKLGIYNENGWIVPKGYHLEGQYVCVVPLEEIYKLIEEAGLKVEKIELNEFTEYNRTRHNSYWYITVLKEN